MASYDKVIPPGGEGKISIKMKTGNLKGKIKKSIRVYTNDPAYNKGILTLTFTASIKPIIDVKPSANISLRGKRGETQSAKVTITGIEDRPLKLEEKYFDLTDIVEYSLDTIEENRSYMVSIKNIPGASDSFKGYLRLKTNYPEKPEIKIYVRGIFR